MCRNYLPLIQLLIKKIKLERVRLRQDNLMNKKNMKKRL